jgi:hypothetical protein
MEKSNNINLPQDYTKLSPYKKRLVREAYIEKQLGKCPHCGGRLNEKPPQEITDLELDMRLFPPNFLKYPIHLHHDHGTGLTIGAVHAYCNGVLFQYYGE